ncbi:hypothetical protein FGG08_006119 [Glutinoglossum americanum]|uniref:Uncharacterized protein n=1 Tax=Glutinoglossum americanum TaxID=1670608 RepID=A0A9P8I1W2_9PEZI|nr:hypothetical protein FGG08_006119 [Glutinoglossum americanum]
MEVVLVFAGGLPNPPPSRSHFHSPTLNLNLVVGARKSAMPQTTNNPHTTFLSLPPEVRETIYEYALTLPPRDSLRPVISSAWEGSTFTAKPDTPCRSMVTIRSTSIIPLRAFISFEPGEATLFRPNVALLRANHQIHSEVAFVLYNRPVYSFLNHVYLNQDEAWENLGIFLHQIGKKNRMLVREIRLRMPPDIWFPPSQWHRLIKTRSAIFKPSIRRLCCKSSPLVEPVCQTLRSMAARPASQDPAAAHPRGSLERLFLLEQHQSHPGADVWNIWQWGLGSEGFDVIYQKREDDGLDSDVAEFTGNCENLKVEVSKWAQEAIAGGWENHVRLVFRRYRDQMTTWGWREIPGEGRGLYPEVG